MIIKLDDIFNFNTNIYIQKELMENGFTILSNNCDIKNSKLTFTTIFDNTNFDLTLDRQKNNYPRCVYKIIKDVQIKPTENSFVIDLDDIKKTIEKLASEKRKEEEEKRKLESDKRAVEFKLSMIQAKVEGDLQTFFKKWNCVASKNGSMQIHFTTEYIQGETISIELSNYHKRETFLDTDINELIFKFSYHNINRKIKGKDIHDLLSKIQANISTSILKIKEIEKMQNRISELQKEIKRLNSERINNIQDARTELKTNISAVINGTDNYFLVDYPINKIKQHYISIKGGIQESLDSYIVKFDEEEDVEDDDILFFRRLKDG